MPFYKIPKSDEDLLLECNVETFRSSGKGGQHANKTESAVRLTHVASGIKVTCQKERSQHQNKVHCIKEMRKRLKQKNYIPPKRIKTKPTRGSIERRISTKKNHSEKKKNRKNPNINNY